MLSRNSANCIGEARLSRGCQVTDAHRVKSTAVLIIGGGWTGVSAALELERIGIDAVAEMARRLNPSQRLESVPNDVVEQAQRSVKRAARPMLDVNGLS
jgi:NADPH-dependent 2,4-dienoyl-CoA reductase/sulfur reductase-like enzyme